MSAPTLRMQRVQRFDEFVLAGKNLIFGEKFAT
jgi:hypothetical protein